MQAMVLHRAGEPLRWQELPDPHAGLGEVRLRVQACAVCRTDLHVVDGELDLPRLPIIPGHEIVGIVDEVGPSVAGVKPGDRLGVPWLAETCGHCRFCVGGQENLCDRPVFTGHGKHGGFASHVVANAAYCIPLDKAAHAVALAPLLCAGLIGWRALRAAPDGAMELGLYGFGAAAHLIAQVARREGRRVYAFTRPGDAAAQSLAMKLGAAWAGDSQERPPVDLDAAILFAPAGELVPQALASVRKGGCVVCGGIHMSDIPSFPYRLLWGERHLCSVANLTRADARQFMMAIGDRPLEVQTRTYPLAQANEALADLRGGRIQGAAVLVPEGIP